MSQERTSRPERKPIVRQAKLEADERDGYKRRWVIDDVNRLQMFKEAGYTFVHEKGKSDSSDSRRSRRAGDHDPRNMYLMEIPTKHYEEDQAIKQRQVDEVDETIRTGGQSTVSNSYLPKSTLGGDAVRQEVRDKI